MRNKQNMQDFETIEYNKCFPFCFQFNIQSDHKKRSAKFIVPITNYKVMHTKTDTFRRLFKEMSTGIITFNQSENKEFVRKS